MSRQPLAFAIALALLLSIAAARRPSKEQLIAEVKNVRAALKDPKLSTRYRASGMFLDTLIPQLESNWNPTDEFLASADGKTVLLPEDTAIGSAAPGALYDMMKPGLKRKEVPKAVTASGVKGRKGKPAIGKGKARIKNSSLYKGKFFIIHGVDGVQKA
ncbi:unnamed protein product [Closterium sp. NIES-54]